MDILWITPPTDGIMVKREFMHAVFAMERKFAWTRHSLKVCREVFPVHSVIEYYIINYPLITFIQLDN